MGNVIREAAISVLKRYEHGIKVEQTGPDSAAQLTMSVKGADSQDARVEVLDAMSLLSEGTIKIVPSAGDAQRFTSVASSSESPKPVDIKDRHAYNTNPVLHIVKQLTDAGVNFPGSERFRPREVV